jgi:antitoxin MazE
MVSQVTVGRWGKNLAIRLPGEIVRAAGLSSGERLDIETHAGEIVLRRAVPHFTLEELFRGKNPEKWRASYAEAVDWGPDVGGEVIEG